jgi:hypothetical protein
MQVGSSSSTLEGISENGHTILLPTLDVVY